MQFCAVNEWSCETFFCDLSRPASPLPFLSLSEAQSVAIHKITEHSKTLPNKA